MAATIASVGSSYDRQSELKAFDQTKIGVKGLVDAGIWKIPPIFFHPRETTPKISTVAIKIPVMDLQSTHTASMLSRFLLMCYLVIAIANSISSSNLFCDCVQGSNILEADNLKNGLLPRVVDELFDSINFCGEETAYKIKLSMISTLDGEEALKVLCGGIANRAVGETQINAGSSRSHCMYMFTIRKEVTNENRVSSGKVVLVDLVGYVKVEKTGAEGKVLEEAKSINKSLSARGNILEFVHGDKSVAELMDVGRQVLGRRQLLPTVPHLLDSVQVEGTFPDGTKLITVHDPVSYENGNLEMALHGSFLPVPSLEKFPNIESCKLPGELIFRHGYTMLNSGREAVVLKVTNNGDRPIQVGSHYHFIEVNPSLIFDRRKAYGMRLNILVGTATRFEPWDAKSLTLVKIGGMQVIRGGNAIVDSPVTDSNVKTVIESALSLAYKMACQTYAN
ncbi:unnamed protein product [Lactuca virosa]|uniref:urease n=1 Tax=Lactuca virosa TaxID=75947 RepID=A0AAU9MJ35_9ASTR|nr:unnamed protein product [Lactuca virosa]